MRLFVAVVPPSAALDHLRTAVDRLRAASPLERPALRWVAPEHWHLTLEFLGEVDASISPRVQEALASVTAQQPPLALTLTGGGRFDGRVLWVGLGGDTDGLRELAAAVRCAAAVAGVLTEDRLWRAHLTLARARRPVDLGDLVARLADYAGPTWPVEQLLLMRSHLGRAVRYETVAAWPLHRAG